MDLLKYYGMRVICVGISVYCKISYAHDITTEDHVVQYYGEIRKEDVLQKVFEGVFKITNRRLIIIFVYNGLGTKTFNYKYYVF